MKQETATLPHSWSFPTAIGQRIALLPSWIWVAALTLLAFGLRQYHLGAESFWFDEADIVRQAQAPASHILTSFGEAGANGPLYTLLLHFWINIVGTHEASVRILSMLFGSAAIPLIYYLGKQLLNRELGLLAAALLTISPFHIWHSQDAKMYTLVVLLALLSSIVYLRALQRDSAGWWIAFVLVTWISLFTHMFAALILIAQLLAAPIIWWTRRDRSAVVPRKLIRHWFIAFGVLLLPILPLAYERAEALTFGYIDAAWYPVSGFVDEFGVILTTLSVNRALQPWELVGTVIMVGLALLGALPWAWRRWALPAEPGPSPLSPRRSGRQAFLILMFALPVLVFGLVTLRVPLFEPRYLIIVLPFFLLLVAAGLLRLARVTPLLGLLGVALALAPSVAALTQINYSAEPQKEEWRQALAYVRDHVRARDVIIVSPGYLKTAVDFYYHSAPNVPIVPIVGVPNLQTENFGERQLDAWLLDQITDHERAWLITSPLRSAKEDPTDSVRWFFEGNRSEWRMFDDPHEYIGVKLYGYAFNGQPRSWFPQPTVVQDVQYEHNFNFRGYIYEIPRQDPAIAQNASWLPLTLYWRFSKPPTPDQNYAMELKLLDENNKEWAHWAAEPLNGYRRTSEFPTDALMIDYRDVWIGGDVPPGKYHLTLAVYPAGHPETPLHILAGAPAGATTLDLRVPITIEQWQPPAGQ